MHPTAAGLLMFGEEYKILYEFPEYFLDYREVLDPSIRWTDRVQSSSGDWTGNLFDFFFRVYGKLVKDLKIPFKLEGITRVDDTPVHKALREALANCLVNTDFYFPRGIVIRKDAESITMENPGSIRKMCIRDRKHSSEVWDILGAVKTEFDKFGDVLAATQNRISQAGAELDKLIGTRTRGIQRKLRSVSRMEEEESRKLLNFTDDTHERN